MEEQQQQHSRSTLADFVLEGRLGSGTFGTVYRVTRKADGQTYALKEVDLRSMRTQEQDDCMRECSLLAALESPYIIKFFDSFLQKGKLYICMEYAPGGNLYDFIRAQSEPLPEDVVWRLFIQMLLGLHYMHGRKVLHRDFKTLNVFLDQQQHVRLGDLGVAKMLSEQTLHAQTLTGTPYYLSPEMCEDKPYNEKSDVWALGVGLYECCARRHPFDADNQASLILKILRGKYPPLTGYSKALTDMVKACLTQDASKRPSTSSLLAMKAVRERAQQLHIELPPLPSKPPPSPPAASPPPTARPSRPSITAAKSFQSRRDKEVAASDASAAGQPQQQQPATAGAQGAAAAAAAGPVSSRSPPVGRTPSARMLAAVSRVDIAAAGLAGLPARGPSPGPTSTGSSRGAAGGAGIVSRSSSRRSTATDDPPAAAAGVLSAGLEKQVQGLKLSPREMARSPRRTSATGNIAADRTPSSCVAASSATAEVQPPQPESGSSEDDMTPPPPPTERCRRLQQTLPAVKTQIIQLVGPLAFDALRSIIMAAAQEAGDAGAPGEQQPEQQQSASLLAAVQRVVPSSSQAAAVRPLLVKLMYLETQLVDDADDGGGDGCEHVCCV